jgi:tetratricopeptide (TPR) repeat protein
MQRVVYFISCVVFVAALVIFAQDASSEMESASPARAERLFLEGKYDRAIHEADLLIDSRASRRDELYYLKGLSELKSNKFKDARESFSSIISRYPGSKRVCDAHVAIGDSYFLEGNMDVALKNYQEAADKFSGDKNITVIYYKIGSVYKRKGASDKAAYYFDKVKAGAPLSFEARMISSSGHDKGPSEAPVRTGSGGSGIYSVQVGSFKNSRNAERMVKELANSGYESYIEPPSVSGGNLYRVKAGKCGSKEDAESLAAKLRKAGYSIKICSNDACQ